jgi:hypothetical protein
MKRQLWRLASLGGWLAHVLNQNVAWNYDFSASVRPGFIFVYVFGFGLGPAVGCLVEAQYLLGYSARPAIASSESLAVIPFGLFGLFALLLIVGWLVRFVPFVADEVQTPSDLAPMALGTVIPVHATGILRISKYRRRFRHRTAKIELEKDGQLWVLVKRHPELYKPPKEWLTAASAHLEPSNTRRIRRGTAHLVFDARPAIELTWLDGPILLDFDDLATRDLVYSELRRLLDPVGPSPDDKNAARSRALPSSSS